LTLMAGSIVPAAARDHRWDGGRGWHRHHDGFGFGDAVGVAALVGAVAIVANSMSKDRKSADAPVDRDRDATVRTDETRRDDGPYDSRDDTWSKQDTRVADDAPADSGNLASEDSAVDACAIAARDEASNGGGYAEIRDIGAPKAVSGGWDVDGRVEHRSGYRGQSGDLRRFTCSIRDGRVSNVYLSKDSAA
jgi:hypothetical protein